MAHGSLFTQVGTITIIKCFIVFRYLHWWIPVNNQHCHSQVDPGLNPKDVNAMNRVLLQDSQQFKAMMEERFKQPNIEWDARITSLTDGPAIFLTMDDTLALKIQEHHESMQSTELTACILDRTHIATEILDIDFVSKKKYFVLCQRITGHWSLHNVWTF